MIRPVRITPPATTPVSLAEAKAHLRVMGAEEDSLIEGYIAGATSHLDGYSGVLGRCLVDQVWRQDFNDWRDLRLPFPDVKNVSVVWRDGEGTPTTVAVNDYFTEMNDLGFHVRFVSGWSAPSLPMTGAAPVSVTFTAGYGAPADVNAGLRHAILLMVGHWYENREAVGEKGQEMPLAFNALIQPHRHMV